jgi:2'-5' RNA ligase
MMRVFFGLDIPAPQRSALAVQQFLLPLPKAQDPQDFHLTLVFLGELPEDRVEEAHQIAETLRLPAFDLTIADLGLFGGDRPRVVWAGVQPCEPLMRLQARLETALRRAGFDPDGRRYAPHVTLGRWSQALLPDQAMRLQRAVAETRFDLPPFRVEAFALFQSLPGVKQGRYPVLVRYPLG